MFKQSASITVAGLALGGLLLAGSPAGAQIVNAPYVEQQGDYQINHNDRTAGGYGSNWSGHTNSGYSGNTYDPRIERREAYQERTIRQGIRSGDLTRGEARYLNQEQARIDRVEDRMMSDGNLSARERQRLSQMQNQAGRDIYRMENNHRTAGGYGDNRPGWQGHNRDWDGRNHGWQANNRGWDRRDAGWQNHNRGYDGRNYGWQGHNPVGPGHASGRNDYNHGGQTNHRGDGRNDGWHGNNPVGAGHTPGGNGYNHGGQANGNSGWHGTNPTGNGYPSRAGYTPGQGNGNSGWHGTNPSGNGYPSRGTAPGGTPAASNPQGWQGNSARHGQPGGYQQPASPAGARPGQPAAWQGQRPSAPAAQPQMRPSQSAPWQGRQQLQQARAPMPQPTMRPNTNMAARQPMLGGMVNRASFSAPRGGSAPTMRRR